MINSAAIFLINIYQKIFSPDHGPLKRLARFGVCKFYPTCSEYAKQALQKKSFLKAIHLILWRLLRCNPLSAGGIDEV